ncbi:hypothetical protein OG921_04600 [Aldersonia sp. NBC_00410]|uniref:hypothetical protein n=1 Tax=Aldersonia sp. NBC_00410 TaxID=2975954 RepID=UPI00225249D9|nr:hypothetical protein [Aldersonia sp. NBC_00410]MCX5042452.1 hypothetical protein [Aldersonia sp. NBC_00410]
MVHEAVDHRRRDDVVAEYLAPANCNCHRDNRARLHSRLNYVAPDEFEAAHYAQQTTLQPEPSPA